MPTFGQGIRLGLACAIVATAALVLVLTPLGEQSWQLLRHPNAERLAQLLEATTTWLPLVLVGLMILHTLIPIPAELLALTAGMTLGPFWGCVTIWIGAMLGAYLGFFLARTLGQPCLRHLIAPQRLEHWQERLRQANVPLLLAVRMLPVISFNLINFALGLSPIGWWRFTWTTGVGIMPVTVFVVVFGAHLGDWRMLVLMVLATILVSAGGYLLWRRHAAPGLHQIDG
jgi:uncharacterized membrane protein YdjX (TVP38/TMEM64 family)